METKTIGCAGMEINKANLKVITDSINYCNETLEEMGEPNDNWSKDTINKNNGFVESLCVLHKVQKEMIDYFVDLETERDIARQYEELMLKFPVM